MSRTAALTVVIPTMNRPDSLERTLRHMADGSVTPRQIVVVDQSTDTSLRDGNKKIAGKFRQIFERFDYVYQEVASLTKARNTGLLYVENETIVFADDDIDVETDTLANVDRLMHNPTIAMIGGLDRLTRRSESNIGYLLGTKSYFRRKTGHVTRSMLGRYPDDLDGQTATQWAQGFFFVVRKSLIEKWGCRWDENLTSYAYAEDLDFSFSYYKHAKAEGLRCILDPTVGVNHLATLEYRIPGEKSLYMYLVNRAYLSHKHRMGLRGEIAGAWCNLWRLVEHVVRRQQPGTFAKAWLRSVRYRREINGGHLDYDKFMK